MLAVIFEVALKSERMDEYLGLAAALRPELERIAGFVSVERFRHLGQPGRLLSLSLWEDAAAVTSWRTHPPHQAAQFKGRAEIFADYRLRVGEVLSDTYPPDGRVLHAPATVPPDARIATLTEPDGDVLPSVEHPAIDQASVFESLQAPERKLLLLSWREAGAALACPAPTRSRHRLVRVIRDYGMNQRAEAMQQFG